VFDGDQLVYAIAKHRSESGYMKGGVVGTLMTNLGMEHALGRLDIPFARAKVGDRYVLELLQQNGWQLGGETSGHVLCLDKHTTGDGIISALQVLHALRDSHSSLAEYTRDLTLYPQVLLNVRVVKGFDLSDGAVQKACGEAEAALGKEGRIVLRASGTEPLIRVMVESTCPELSMRQAEHIAAAVRLAAP
jgi:phosphoglucosamine mutase